MGIALHPCDLPYLEAFVGDYIGDNIGKEYGVDDSSRTLAITVW